jgi:hypothetical protein
LVQNSVQGFIPQLFTNTICMEQQQHVVSWAQLYFQQIWPMQSSTADDGRMVAHMLMDTLEQTKPKKLAATVRAFVSQMAMLRDCGCMHLASLLVALVSADSPSSSQLDGTVSTGDPAILTEDEAAAIGSALAALLDEGVQPHVAVANLVGACMVLRTMQTLHLWFVPMMAVLSSRRQVFLRSGLQPLPRRISSFFSARISPSGTVCGDIEDGANFHPVVRTKPGHPPSGTLCSLLWAAGAKASYFGVRLGQLCGRGR